VTRVASTIRAALAVDAPSLPAALAIGARVHPNRAFLRSVSSGFAEVSYAEADRRVDAYAAGLQQLGTNPGDRVVLVMDNSVEQVLVWLGLNRIGAVNVPVNPALRGDLLARALRTVRPILLIVDEAFAPALAAAAVVADLAGLPIFVHAHGTGEGVLPAGRDLRYLSGLAAAALPTPVVLEDLAPATMLFTSGSTGTPKACVLSHRHLAREGQIHAKYLALNSADVLFTPFPLFHIDAATLTVGAALAIGATAALTDRFSASRFWDQVRASNATVFNFMGATANILWTQPLRPTDRQHRVRLAWGVPMPVCAPEWQARFGFPLVEVYGLTDSGLPAYQPLGEPHRPGSCGRVIPEYDVRIADENDMPVQAGDVGQILIRSDDPGLLMSEYFANPRLTRQAMRGGWFHTGDLGRLDADRHLYFVSRSREVIRRRGENIAAGDVEAAVDAHPAVQLSAAVGVPSELSEDDIKVFVVPQPGLGLTEADLLEHCRERLPRHMVPRYVEILDRLPKTPTEKVERMTLAARPLTSATWDDQSGGFLSTPQEGTP
jgi:carnitine-CoA ligase